MRRKTSLIAAGALLVQALGFAGPVRAADPVTVTFSYTGVEQSWVVPADVTSILVVLVGGDGGAGFGPGAAGGGAHRAEATVAVIPGQTIYVEVGGHGLPGSLDVGGLGGFNGGGDGGDGGEAGSGGGGGGATDLRTVSRDSAGTLASRLIIAAGGGGGGAPAGTGGAGGNAGEPGANSIGGGISGGAPGFDGVFGCSGCGGDVGGEDGVAGSGGSGGNDPFEGTGAGGGGGGGGYFGGGGGGAGFSSAGGGGGSSFADGWSLDNPNVTLDTTGVSSASITYAPGAGGGGDSSTGTVDAVVTMAESAVCLELSTTSIDFGTRQFGDVGAPATPLIDIANCGGVSESILARGTNATGAGPSAWSLVASGSCVDATLGLDEFRLRLEDQATEDQVSLTTTNTALQTLAGGASASHEALIDTPCPGSSGAGAVMAMQIVFVATE